jgi:predicted ATPase
MLTALRGCLSQHPVLVAIDDVQWLDEASREVLAFALRRVTDGPLSLLVAARTEAAADPLTVGAPPPPRDWHELLAGLPAAEVIDLAPLDLWQVQNLLPPDVTAARARLVAGNRAATRSGRSSSRPAWTRTIARCRHWRAP